MRLASAVYIVELKKEGAWDLKYGGVALLVV